MTGEVTKGKTLMEEHTGETEKEEETRQGLISK